MTATEFVFALIGAAVGVTGVWLAVWARRRRHRLRWGYLEPESMLDVAEHVASAITISYEGAHISNLTRHRFVLHNNGHEPLTGDDIREPVTWKAPGRVFSADVRNSRPPVKLDIKVSKESNDTVTIGWALFNPRCLAVIEVLSEAGSGAGNGTLSWDIMNISEIEQRRIAWMASDFGSTRQGQNPATPGAIGHLFADNPRYATLGFGSLYVLGGAALLLVNLSLVWQLAGAVLFLVAFVIAAILLRNPYGRILRETFGQPQGGGGEIEGGGS